MPYFFKVQHSCKNCKCYLHPNEVVNESRSYSHLLCLSRLYKIIMKNKLKIIKLDDIKNII